MSALYRGMLCVGLHCLRGPFSGTSLQHLVVPGAQYCLLPPCAGDDCSLRYCHRSYCEQKELYRTVTVPANQNGKPRIVVFDAPGALKSFLRPAKRGLLYDFHQQQQKVHNMVRAFKQQGYELVVFLDCNIPDDKLTTWYRRRFVQLLKHASWDAMLAVW